MSQRESHHFQAEIQQLLDIVVHSLYTDKEIFIRELISNAADACEKLRFNQSSGQPVQQPEVAPAIAVVTDEKAGTITFTDTGLGHDARRVGGEPGHHRAFGHQGVSEADCRRSQKPDVGLIGQFGVGFYSAFMVAKKVTVLSRSFVAVTEQGWEWTSEGMGGL
jgi:TNF receptor-associated protein 1